MSLAYEYSVIRDTASPALAELAGKLTPQRMAAAIGPACARLVRTHLRNLPTNKRGWPSTGFWAGAARSTNWTPTEEGALVSVNQVGVRQRYFGGTIKPVNVRALTIPISPVAYGHTAKDFPGAFLLKTKKGAYLVQYGDGTGAEKKRARAKRIRGLGGNGKRRQQATLNFLFKLVGSVDQAPNPNVLPDKEALAEVAMGALKAALKPKGGTTA